MKVIKRTFDGDTTNERVVALGLTDQQASDVAEALGAPARDGLYLAVPDDYVGEVRPLHVYVSVEDGCVQEVEVLDPIDGSSVPFTLEVDDMDCGNPEVDEDEPI